MRRLATIQTILNLRPIPGADLIEVADVLGWSVVVKKGDFKVGDLCVYFEIDSWCDESIPAFQADVFVQRYTNWGDKRGMRLKTIKLRKQISQGLVLALTDFPEIKNPVENDDVTELLKIEKWESLAEYQGNGGGMGAKTAGAKPFPGFIRKTDQERVQNYITELPKHATETFEVTIKLDGSSMTVFRIAQDSPHFQFAWEDIETRQLRKKGPVGRFFYKLGKLVGLNRAPKFLDGVCSRNIQLDPNGSNHFSEYVAKHDILERLDNLGQNVAIQGELIAPSIQENYEQVMDYEFYVYDVFNIDQQKYFLPWEARAICHTLGLDYVPVLNENASLMDFAEAGNGDLRALVENILTFAEGPGMNAGVKREGVVFKSNDSEFSFKAISNSYLLKKKD